jgi:hypothetical protein
MSENPPFLKGELVTRDGTDVHEVVDVDDGLGGIVVRCVTAPKSRWTEVGDIENNLASRYLRVSQKGQKR